jgi:hypothetical protein
MMLERAYAIKPLPTNKARIEGVRKSEELGRVGPNGGVTYLGTNEVFSFFFRVLRDIGWF